MEHALTSSNLTCGCCKTWIDHLKTNGFRVEYIVTPDIAKNDKFGLPAQLVSYRMAVVNGYVIEEHVPANDIKQLLKHKPDITGLPIPGMPAGSPGMEMGGQQYPFDVIAFDKAGTMSRFSHYPAR